MPTIQIDIPTNAQATRITEAFAAEYGYQPTIDGAPNPETKAQFAKRMVAQFVKDVTLGYEEKRDVEATRATIKAAANLPVS